MPIGARHASFAKAGDKATGIKKNKAAGRREVETIAGRRRDLLTSPRTDVARTTWMLQLQTEGGRGLWEDW